MSPMSPRLLRPRATGFDPRSISNLAYWLDATDSATVTTVNGAVSSWASKAGTGTATQGIAANRPTYTTAGRNGKNVISFDGTNDFLTSSTLSINQPFSIVFAGFQATQSANSQYVCDGGTSTTRVVLAWNATGGAVGRLFMFCGTIVSPGSGQQAFGEWAVSSAVFNGASSQLRVNGSQIATGNPGSTAITALTLGARYTGDSLFVGDWGAFLVYSRALSETELLRVERYLGKLFSVNVA